MSTHDEERVLGEALRVAADGAGPSRLTLDDVRGRARGIRRRRAATGAAGAAALVAAAVVPIALLVGGTESEDSLPPADSTPTVTDTANPAPDPTEATDPGAEEPAPGRAWAVGAEVHPPDGPPFELPVDVERGMQFSRLGEDWFVVTYPGDGGPARMSLVDGSGTLLESYDGTGYFQASPTGEAVAWPVEEGVRVLAAGTREPVLLTADLPGPADGWGLPAVRGCGDGEACEVYVSVVGEDGESTYVLEPGAEARPFLPGVLESISDVSPDGRLAAGIVRSEDFETFCGGVVDVATQEVLWEDCPRTGSLRFSADGTQVVANDSFDGPNHGTARVLDATTGTEVVRYDGIVFDEGWDGLDGLLLVVGRSGSEQARIIRLTVPGGAEEEVAPQRDRQLSAAGYVLEHR